MTRRFTVGEQLTASRTALRFRSSTTEGRTSVLSNKTLRDSKGSKNLSLCASQLMDYLEQFTRRVSDA